MVRKAMCCREHRRQLQHRVEAAMGLSRKLGEPGCTVLAVAKVYTPFLLKADLYGVDTSH